MGTTQPSSYTACSLSSTRSLRSIFHTTSLFCWQQIGLQSSLIIRMGTIAPREHFFRARSLHLTLWLLASQLDIHCTFLGPPSDFPCRRAKCIASSFLSTIQHLSVFGVEIAGRTCKSASLSFSRAAAAPLTAAAYLRGLKP